MVQISYVVEGMENDVPGVFGSTGAYAQPLGYQVFGGGLVFGPVVVGAVNPRAGLEVWFGL